LYGGLTLVQDTEALAIYPIPLPQPIDLWITLVTPAIKIKTKDSRQVLPTQLATREWCRQMAHCTTLAVALARGDTQQLAFGLTDSFAEPARASLIPGFKAAKESALGSGAYGFSLSGSGPTCFALSPSKTVAEAVGRGVMGVFGPKAHLHIVQPRLKGAEVYL